MKAEMDALKDLIKSTRIQLLNKELTQEVIEEIKKKLETNGKPLTDRINTLFTSMSQYNRNDWASLKKTTMDDYACLGNEIKRRLDQINRAKESNNKGPLMPDQILRYRQAGEDIEMSTRTGAQTANTLQKTNVQIRADQERMLGVITTTEKIESNLTLHDQVLGVMKNRNLYSKVKLMGVVLILLLGDFLVLFIRLSK